MSVVAAAGAVVLLAVTVVERVAAGRRYRRELARARRLARTDDLTGLANRRGLLDALGEALGSGGPFVLLLADLDGFKAVNDTYGHHTGDQVLQQVAHRLTRAIGTDGLVARLGGDEFAVLTHDCDDTEDHDHEGRCWAGQVRAALTDPVATGPHQIQVTASTGTATREPGDLTPTDLLARADTAMYRTKPAPSRTRPQPPPASRRRTA
jgi:diguanylate cyclase (GGDEF)-like protein